jgi:hypothetical protein
MHVILLSALFVSSILNAAPSVPSDQKSVAQPVDALVQLGAFGRASRLSKEAQVLVRYIQTSQASQRENNSAVTAAAKMIHLLWPKGSAEVRAAVAVCPHRAALELIKRYCLLFDVTDVLIELESDLATSAKKKVQKAVSSICIGAVSGLPELVQSYVHFDEYAVGFSLQEQLKYGLPIQVDNNGQADLIGHRLSDMTGLAHIHSLRQIRGLELSHNRLLHLNGRLFLSCPGPRFKNVRRLIVDNNGLRYMADNACIPFPNLTLLSLASNALTVAPRVASLHNLQSLRLSGNKLVSFDAAQVTSPEQSPLRFLDLSNNPLAQVMGLGGLRQLETIHLDNARLAQVPALSNPGLRHLFMRNNCVETIPVDAFKEVPQLLTLVLSGNQIREIAPGTLSLLSHLHRLDLDGNELGAIPEDVLALVQRGTLKILRLGKSLREAQAEIMRKLWADVGNDPQNLSV